MKKLLLVFVSILTLVSMLLVPMACKEAVEVNTIPENPGGADLADLGMIAFISSRWGNQKDIYLMNSDGTEVYNYSYSPMIDEDEVELDVSGYWMVWTAPIPQAKG
ncbi:MAG: hypothetical protein NTV30_09905, partial [Chloroflexi bacterium]|nr:hypothetical protein [Chloroflexota bacterium]